MLKTIGAWIERHDTATWWIAFGAVFCLGGVVGAWVF